MRNKDEEFDEEIIIDETEEIDDLDEFIEEENLAKDLKENKKKKIKKNKKEVPKIIRDIGEEEAKEIIRKKREKKDDIIVLEDGAENSKIKKKHSKRAANVFFVILFLLIVLVTADIVLVSKFNKGPFFAIPVKTYDDGGTKEYYGLGYKVIKYKQLQGRRDIVIGKWGIKYNVEPITLQAIDLAIEFNNDESLAYENFYKQFIRVVGTLKEVDKYNNVIVIGYEDEDEAGKYSINIKCSMATDYSYLEELSIGKEVTVIGTVSKYKYRTKKTTGELYLENVFAEQ